MMKFVTEMRNAFEYHGKSLPESEKLALHYTWKAILEWSGSAGLTI